MDDYLTRARQVHVHQDTLGRLLKTAQQLQVKGLIEQSGAGGGARAGEVVQVGSQWSRHTGDGGNVVCCRSPASPRQHQAPAYQPLRPSCSPPTTSSRPRPPCRPCPRPPRSPPPARPPPRPPSRSPAPPPPPTAGAAPWPGCWAGAGAGSP